MREGWGYWKGEGWAYCLRPTHAHGMAVPPPEAGLRRASGEAQRRSTRRVHCREGGRGQLWPGRFASVAREERALLAAGRYVEQTPVRAGLAATPWEV